MHCRSVCQEISATDWFVCEFGNSYSKKLNFSGGNSINMFMPVSSLFYQKKCKNITLWAICFSLWSHTFVNMEIKFNCVLVLHNCNINAEGSLSPLPLLCFTGSQMPPQPPGSQSESSSHPALSQSPMPQERGWSSIHILHTFVFWVYKAYMNSLTCAPPYK